MSKTIFDIVTSKNIKGFYEEVTQNDIPPLGASLFPRTKQLGLDLDFIKGKGGLPVVLKPSAFDVKAPLRDRVGLETLHAEMPFFKEAMLIKEKDRQQLLTMMQTGKQELINLVTKKIFNDKKVLLDGGIAQEERLRMQLLTQGYIAVRENNVDLQYDYGMPDANYIETTTAWEDKESTIAKDIMGWIMAAKKKGVIITHALTNSKTIGYMMDNEAIAAEILATQQGAGFVTPAMVGTWIKSKLGIKILLNDSVFIDESGAEKQYVPDDVFTMFPDGILGETVFGTTPEEADLMSGATDAEVSITNTGMAITTTKTTDPVNVNTKVSMVVLPSFEQIDKVFIADISVTDGE